MYLKRLKDWAKKTETLIDDFIVSTIEKRLLPLAYFGVFYICMHGLELKPIFSKGINIAGLLLMIVFGVRFVLQSLNTALTTI